MKFGVTMFPNNLEDVASASRLAEEMGFDYVGIADSQSLARELYVTLGVVAASTERVMLGPTVSNPLTRHPAVAASAIASINELSKGRAFLGLGSGDSAVLNLGLRPARLAELHHYIQSVREMLAGETVEYRGNRAHVRWSSTAIPVAMSAEGPRTLAMAGSVADAAIVHTGLTTDVLWDTVASIREGDAPAGAMRAPPAYGPSPNATSPTTRMRPSMRSRWPWPRRAITPSASLSRERTFPNSIVRRYQYCITSTRPLSTNRSDRPAMPHSPTSWA